MAKRVTSKDIAALAGVSRTTVSFVLNNVPGMRIAPETRQRVLDAARELQYHPDAAARSMASGRRHIIGFVVRQSFTESYSDLFLPQVLNGAAQAAQLQGYRMLFEPVPLDQHSNNLTQLTRERHTDGIILSGPRFDDEEMLYLHTENTPLVLLGQLPGIDIPFVDVNNIQGAFIATRYLLSLGHRRIGMITNAPLAYTASADRLAGYRQALGDAGLPNEAALVQVGDFTAHGGELAANHLLALPKPPTAIFVASDTVALGVLVAVRKRGLSVPADISVIGFDDIPLAEFLSPPLTTIRLPAYGLGWAAAEVLIRRIEDDEDRPNAPIGTLLETELVVRESCAAPMPSHADQR